MRTTIQSVLLLNSALISSYDDADQVIVGVGLVKPIPGVFLEQIEYLLVISTPLDIKLVGIAFSEKRKLNQPRSKLELYQTDMCCNSDKVNMSNIVGTSKGRIFMRGNDGSLYELVYQAQDGWFTRKVYKSNKTTSKMNFLLPFNIWSSDPIRSITLDNDRNLLYTVSKRNEIEVFDLGADGMGFASVARISNLSSQLQRFNTFDDHIISMHPTMITESRVLHLVAITSSGHRLLFSTGSSTAFPTLNPHNMYMAPSTLRLCYVLPPPLDIPMNDSGAKVHESFYFNGMTIAAQALEEFDRILVIAPNAGLIMQDPSRRLSECSSSFSLEGRTWAIAELSSRMSLAMSEDKSFPTYYWNELASQFDFEPRKLFLLTNGGLTTLIKQRPIDLLLSLINLTNLSGTKPYQDFFSAFGADQSCAMCLAIACNHPTITKGHITLPASVCDIASKLYFELGGTTPAKSGVIQPILMRENFRSDFQSGLNALRTFDNPFAKSAKHDGLALYVARILRPIWKQSLVIERKTTLGAILFENTIKIETLVSVQLKLQGLVNFLKKYPKLIARPTPDSIPQAVDQEQWKAEQESMANIHELVNYCVETISFFSLLIDFRISNIAKCLTPDDQTILQKMSFEELVITTAGKELAKQLMAALINNQMNKELGVESVVDSLQQRCPSICEDNDVILYKGLEQLRNAKSYHDQGTSVQHLQEALLLFMKVSRTIPIAKLDEIIETFKGFRFYLGIIDLCLQKAVELGASGLQTAKSVSQIEDMNRERMICYQFVFQTLSSIESLADPQVTTPALSRNEVQKLKSMALQRAISSSDKMFHFSLYTWYIEKQWIEQLLEIKSPYLEEFLWTGRTDLHLADYLSRFYIRNNRFSDAAQLLCDVAHYPGLTLDQRLMYLTSSLTNAKSASGPSTQDLLSQLTDELDVARVQADILAELSKIPNTENEIKALNDSLMEVGQLFSQFARPFYMYEIMLQIFFVSDHSGEQCQAIIENCWEEIFRNTVKSAHQRSAVEALSDKILELGRRFYPEDSVFPLCI